VSAVDFFASSRVLIVAGKGGVGKTTVGATVGVAAAAAGCDVLLVELEGMSTLAAPFGLDALGYEPTTLIGPGAAVSGGPDAGDGGGRLQARRITPDEALAEYLDASGLRVVTDRMARSGAVEVVATTAPGIRDLVTLGKIRQLEQGGEADLIVVDAPAAGHAITFLRAASGLARSTSSGPVRHQADLVLDLLGDAERCQVMLVTTPEETPVTEVVETAYSLEDQVGVALGPVVVNACWPPIDGLDQALAAEASTEGGTGGAGSDPWRRELLDAARYRLARIERQRTEITRLQRELPLPTIELPFLFTTSLGRDDLDELARALTAQLDRSSAGVAGS
jgi:anion-transporting  ArsA/GET3 family ATPase